MSTLLTKCISIEEVKALYMEYWYDGRMQVAIKSNQLRFQIELRFQYLGGMESLKGYQLFEASSTKMEGSVDIFLAVQFSVLTMNTLSVKIGS